MVEWRDTWTKDGWSSVDDLLASYDPKVQTIGIFAGINMSRSWVLISGLLDDTDVIQQAGAATWFIPSRMVDGWHLLKAKGGRRE